MRYDARLNTSDTVADLVHSGVLEAWNVDLPVLLPGRSDKILWVVGHTVAEFSASLALDSIRLQLPRVPWAKMVWFSQCIPKHAFHLWLLMKNRLLTQDIILKVWDKIRQKLGFRATPPMWSSIIEEVCQNANLKSFDSVVGRLGIAVASYFVWQERNNRLFRNQTRPPDILTDQILATIRYRLCSLKFRRSALVEARLASWDIQDSEVLDNGG
ncbi:hypothetical protein SSX86_007341 [Deinandra increscens subsp. villosa]|uniref:Reverse transcriptase zinc-binding domain-containing protein n=1 Tax=Deinandra increscens subsp. villosa TaxID=3103831 RepID=A0AAP0H4V5_9ASTR